MKNTGRVAMAMASILLAGVPGRAEAQERAIEIAVDIGLLDRGTTGVGAPLLDMGYDVEGGPVAGVGVRMLFGIDGGRYFHHGAAVRTWRHGGGDFGLSEGHGLSSSSLDLAYAFRTALPCMSAPGRELKLTGMLGVTGIDEDAGRGSGHSGQLEAQRAAAAEQFDHFALGPMLGVGIDFHSGPLFAGLAFDLREVFAFDDGPISRSYFASAALRMGVALAP